MAKKSRTSDNVTISDMGRDVAAANPGRDTHSGMDMQGEIDRHLASIGGAINTGIGNAVGGVAEKAILGGREATGTHKFSETYQGKRRARMAGIKGINANREF